MSEQKTIFEGLYQIDWDSLNHVNEETAIGVPNALRDLLSNDELTRALARRILFDEGKADWGMYTEANRYLVPFVCELLPFEAVQERSHLLYNLSVILVCNRRFVSTNHSKDYVFIYSTVEKYLPVILTLLHHKDEDIRSRAADLLRTMDGNIETVVPELIARFKIETDEAVQINILKALEDLFSYNNPESWSLRHEYSSFFRSIVESDLTEYLRYWGACAGLMASPSLSNSRYVHEDEISPQTASIIVERFWRPYIHRNYYGVESCLLKIMLLPNAVSLLWDILHDPRLHAEDQEIVLRALLHAKFQSRWSLDYPKIVSHLQIHRDAEGYTYNNIGVERKNLKGDSLLKDIVEDDGLWHQHPTHLFSYFLGLPDSRDELRAFLESDKD